MSTAADGRRAAPAPRAAASVSYREALTQAMREEMQRDPAVFVMGEDVGRFEGAFKVTRGLLREFGERRVVDTPISEAGFVGIGVGAAMAGLARLGGGTLRFTDAAVATFLIFMSFNLVDLLFIDWLLLVKLRAPLFTIPGAELPAVYGDYGYHGRGFLKGTLGIALLSPLLAALAVLIW